MLILNKLLVKRELHSFVIKSRAF